MSISIIIPVYNVKPFVHICLDSVINQTFKDLEIILVDDGSSDGSEMICDEYIKDTRVTVIHQHNQGLSAARNSGLKIASGKYIMFVDSDDWVESDFCEIPYKVAVLNDADIVFFRYWRYRDGRENVVGADVSEGFKNSQTAMNMLINGTGVMVWNKIYKRALWENEYFPIGKYFEDNVITPLLVHKAQRVYSIRTPLYHYRYREGSIVTLKDRKVHRDHRELQMERICLLDEWGYTQEVERQSIDLYWDYLIGTGAKERYSKACREYILKAGGLPDGYSWRSRILWRLLGYSPILFDVVCFITGQRSI